MGLEGQIVPGRDYRGSKTYKGSGLRHAFLSREEEFRLCDTWKIHRDIDARNEVVLAYMPLAISVISKSGGLRDIANRDDLRQEAMIALIQALDGFDTAKGFRFSTYARWWIRARLREVSFANKSLVKTRAGANMKKIQSNFGKALLNVETAARRKGENVLRMELRMRAAKKIGVPSAVVESCYLHVMSADVSLNRKIGLGKADTLELIDIIPDEKVSSEDSMALKQTASLAKDIVAGAMKKLTDREKIIVHGRYLSEDRQTLSTLSDEIGVSRERIRQIEVVALNKITCAIRGDPGSRKTIIDLFGV